MHYLALFFIGAFFSNCLPHLTSGSQGRPFPTPFATPHGVGDSSPLVWTTNTGPVTPTQNGDGSFSFTDTDLPPNQLNELFVAPADNNAAGAALFVVIVPDVVLLPVTISVNGREVLAGQSWFWSDSLTLEGEVNHLPIAALCHIKAKTCDVTIAGIPGITLNF